MSENPINISSLNDFIFCPASIYFHSLESKEEDLLSKDSFQLDGTNAHRNSDSAMYSTKKSILQGVSVYSCRYDLCGKIDTFDCEKGILTERKKKIKSVYEGYVFQLYAQYFALLDMGYAVKEIRLYSMDDNKVYKIALPELDDEMFSSFIKVLHDIKNFNFETFQQINEKKCNNCIYETLCSFSTMKRGEKNVDCS